jgi:hypothetical protein
MREREGRHSDQGLPSRYVFTPTDSREVQYSVVLYMIVLHSYVPVQRLCILDLTLSLLQCLVLPSCSGSYNQEIHEMTEAQAFGMGQYGHNNQPVD